jgi:hypothetical protein
MDLTDVYKLIHRLGGPAGELLGPDLERLRNATAGLDSAICNCARARWVGLESDVRRSEGDLEVARGRWLEACASLESHGAEAVTAALATIVRMLIERRLP